MQSINPYTGQVIQEYWEHTPEEVEQIIVEVDQAFHSWKKTGFEQRSVCIKRLQTKLLEKKEMLADVIVSEMGKVNREALLK